MKGNSGHKFLDLFALIDVADSKDVILEGLCLKSVMKY